MDKLPREIKTKLRKIHKLTYECRELSNDITKFLEEYNLDTEIFSASANLPFNEQTEALTYIEYGEGDAEENIAEFEKVFLLHINKRSE